jgi:predicted SAM-dependent methyltransferase
MEGIFTEHCIEHFPLRMVLRILREVRRVLRPRGLLRVVVPDGGMYLSTYVKQLQGQRDARFPFQETEDFEGIHSPILSVNRIFYQDRESPFGHHCVYDFDLIRQLLLKSGFSAVTRLQFGKGQNPRLLIDSESRQSESLYVEAITGAHNWELKVG